MFNKVLNDAVSDPPAKFLYGGQAQRTMIAAILLSTQSTYPNHLPFFLHSLASIKKFDQQYTTYVDLINKTLL